MELEQWDDFVSERYDPNRKAEDFRKFDDSAPAGVREFYRLNHTNQTRDFVLAKKGEFGSRDRRRMGIWEALEYLNTLVDESDPDTDLSQIEHCFKPPKRSAAMGILAGWCWLGWFTTLAKSYACTVSRSGQWWATPFRWAARGRNALSSPNTSPPIRIPRCRNIRPGSVFTKRVAASIKWTSRGATTSICTRW